MELVSISTDLVSVTVPGGWLLLAELPWIPACPAQGFVAQGLLLALEPAPTLSGTIPKLIYCR